MNTGVKAVVQSILSGVGRRSSFMALPVWTSIVWLAAAYIFGREDSMRPLCPWLVAVAALNALMIPLAFLVFLFRAPERLQSEAHQVQLKALQILKEQCHNGNVRPACLEKAIETVIAPLLRRD
jgi:hypothetical protein